MNIENYKITAVEGYKRVTFDFSSGGHDTFTIIIQGTNYGCTQWAVYKGKQVNDIDQLAFDLGYSISEYERLDDYIEGQTNVVHNFYH